MKKRVFYILNIFLVLSLKIFALNFIENKEIHQFWLRGPRELLPLVELGASWKVPN